jgi:hypothetical protein
LACEGIVSGYVDGTFRPNRLVTRGQLSKIVSNAAGFGDPVAGQTFEDVPPGSTFYTYTERLAVRGIIGGYACGGSPGEPCVPPGNRPYFRTVASATRGQIAKIAYRAYGCMGGVSGQSFEDVPQGSTFYTEIEQLHTLGAISGYPCGGAGEPCVPPLNRAYFRPSVGVTRGQVSKIAASVFFPECTP